MMHKSCHTTRQEPTESSKQPIRADHLGHVTGYQPIRDQYFMVGSVPATRTVRLGFRTVFCEIRQTGPPKYDFLLYIFTVFVWFFFTVNQVAGDLPCNNLIMVTDERAH